MKSFRRKKRFLCLFLALILAATPIVPVQAKENKLVHVYTSSDRITGKFWLPLLNVDGQAFISLEDACLLTGLGYEMRDDFVEFYAGPQRISVPRSNTTYDGTEYYPFELLMNSLSTHYQYDEEKQMLSTVSCAAVYGEMLDVCEEMYDGGYTLAYADNALGYGVATIYNVIGGLRFDFVWGGYSTEQYESAVSGIIDLDGATANSLQGAAVNAHEVLDTAVSFADLNLNATEDLTEYCEIFGYRADRFLLGYDNLQEKLPLDAGNLLEVTRRLYAAENAYSVFVNAIRYGAYENSHASNLFLKTATKKIYEYYKENVPDYAAVIQNLGMDAMSGVFTDALEEQLIRGLWGSSSAYFKLFKMALDAAGMGDATKAVEQSHCCYVIQQAAKAEYEDCLEEISNFNAPDTRSDGLLRIKYCTLLYLRACQYAYELYEFDYTLGEDTRYWVERTQKAIEKITAYDDQFLLSKVENAPLDLTAPGFVENLDSQYDTSSLIGYWAVDGYDDETLGLTSEMSIYYADKNRITMDITDVFHDFQNQTVFLNPDGSAEFTLSDASGSASGKLQFDGDTMAFTITESDFVSDTPMETITYRKIHEYPAAGFVDVFISWDDPGFASGAQPTLSYAMQIVSPNGDVYELPNIIDEVRDSAGHLIAMTKLHDDENRQIELLLFDTNYQVTLELASMDMRNHVDGIEKANPTIFVRYANEEGSKDVYNTFYSRASSAEISVDLAGRTSWKALEIRNGKPYQGN